MNEEQKTPPDLKQRTKQFALRAIRLYSALPKSSEAQVIGKQWLRSGKSDQADLLFREQEYGRLRAELEQAFEQSELPEQSNGAAALNDLLMRLRLRSQGET